MALSQTMPTVAEYYNGKTLFITGATGFMGKVSIEKILRSLPGVKKIFMLIRPKKGVSPADRVKQIRKSKVFERLQGMQPDPFEKIHPILGEISELKVGISDEDRKLLIEEVNIIFHMAASVQFTDSICTALKINVRGTREMAELAKQMKSLECFIHVSTAYCNVFNDDYTGEEIYPPVQNWEDLLNLVDEEPEALNILTGRFLCGHPNTYTLTKSLAEQAINSYKNCFPVTIVRPGIVVNAFKDPFPGWVDTFFGPCSFALLTGSGLMKVALMDVDASMDYVSVDHAVNGMLLAPYDKHVSLVKDLNVLNAVYGDTKRLKNGEIRDYGYEFLAENPMTRVFWHPYVFWTSSTKLYSLLFFLLQVIPACFLEVFLILSGSKFRVLRLMKKVISVNDIYQFFSIQEFCFSNHQFLGLEQTLGKEDRDQFPVSMPQGVTTKQWHTILSKGAYKYLFNEPELTPELLRRLQWRDLFLKVLHYTCVAIFAFVVYKVGAKCFLYSQ